MRQAGSLKEVHVQVKSILGRGRRAMGRGLLLYKGFDGIIRISSRTIQAVEPHQLDTWDLTGPFGSNRALAHYPVPEI
jgi:hypothetical protein